MLLRTDLFPKQYLQAVSSCCQGHTHDRWGGGVYEHVLNNQLLRAEGDRSTGDQNESADAAPGAEALQPGRRDQLAGGEREDRPAGPAGDRPGS